MFQTNHQILQSATHAIIRQLEVSSHGQALPRIYTFSLQVFVPTPFISIKLQTS